MDETTAEIAALINLLEDSDLSVIQSVTERLLDIGESAVDPLEKNWELTTSAHLQERIENVIQRIRQNSILGQMRSWVSCRGKDLLYGAFLIARSQYPELEYEPLNMKVESLRTQIWLELNDHLTSMEKVRVINHFLFSVHNFSRSSRGLHTPQLFLVNHVLDTRKGVPVILAAIYAEIASRLDLPIRGVDFPHNFLLCYHDPGYLDDPDGVQFYINPYNRGAILSRQELTYFLEDQQVEVMAEYLKPCENIGMIYRLAEGLRSAYLASGQEEKAVFMDEMIRILENGPVDQAS